MRGKGRLVTDVTNYTQWLRSLQVRPCILISARDSAHNFSVKFNPNVCSHSSFLDWRNGWNLSDVWSGENYTAWLSFAYHAHWTAVTTPAVTNSAWFVCHNKPLNQQCIACPGLPRLALGPRWCMNHLTSNIVVMRVSHTVLYSTLSLQWSCKLGKQVPWI